MKKKTWKKKYGRNQDIDSAVLFGDMYRTRLKFPYHGAYPYWELELYKDRFSQVVDTLCETYECNIRNKRLTRGDYGVIRVFTSLNSEERVQGILRYIRKKLNDPNIKGKWKRDLLTMQEKYGS